MNKIRVQVMNALKTSNVK